MRVCIYARVDGKNQNALDMQIRALRDYAKKNGHSVTSVVSVLGTSGTANKQTLDTILEMADDDVFDAVLTTDPSRLSRDTFAYIEFVEALKAHGKYIYYALSQDDINDGMHTFYAKIWTDKTTGACKWMN